MKLVQTLLHKILRIRGLERMFEKKENRRQRFQRIKMKLSVDWFNFKHNFFWTMHLMILLFGLLCSIAAIILCIIAMGI